MGVRSFDKDELRKAAVAHMAARRDEHREAQRLAEAARAAAEAGMSMHEIAEIVDSSSRGAVDDHDLAA